MSLSEILDDAKYKIGGGVTFSGKQTQFSGLRRYIFDYAKTHWHRNNFDGNPEKSLIEFYDKNGKPIKWKSGLKLKIGEVQFKIPSESNIMWSYGGKPKGSVPVTGKIADASGVFKEVTSTYNAIKDISDAEVTNPVNNKKTNYNNLVKQIYKKYGYTGTNVFGLDMDHFKGVKEHPFKNLRALDRRLNISLGAIDKTFDNRNLKAKLKKEMLGELATKKGGAYDTALRNYFVNQATQVLEKGAVPTLATKSPYYSAVKNVYEQKNLPKVQKELLEKSYQRATKLEQSIRNQVLELASKVTDRCAIGKADGGRIGYSLGSEACFKIGQKKLGDILTKGTGQKGEQLLATQILKAGPLLKDAVSLRALLGPQAMVFYAGAEAGLIGYDMLTKGKTLKEAVADSLINPALGPKLKQDSQKLFVERLKNLGLSDQEIGKGLMFDRMSEDVQTLDDLLQRKSSLDQARTSQRMSPVVADKRKKEADDIAMDIQDIYRTGDRNVLDAFEGKFQKPETQKIFTDAAAQKMALEELAEADRLRGVLDNFYGKFIQGERGRKEAEEKVGRFFDIALKDANPALFSPIQRAGGFTSGFAGGGIAKLAGVDEGPPPESGPNSQGLSGLLKRGNKI
jgi:PIN domain nuclease of toxin-antitoxin system